MLTLIWLAIGVIILVSIILVWEQQGNILPFRQNQALSPRYRNVFNLELGDIVQYEGVDWVVEGKLTYSDGDTWLEYLLQDGDNIRWLSAEEDDWIEVQWLEICTELEISGKPPSQLTLGDITYKLAESGTAKMTRLGNTFNRQTQYCQYFDYKGKGNHVLSVEIWDGDIEVTIGQRISPSSLSLLPGDGRRVYND
ncbi:MAG: DUF4178 domain-containing protein [Nostocaceae cyanobacterium]|nr:DUF4178 domain-containing protein [Nostocaceae cyanobacterium]